MSEENVNFVDYKVTDGDFARIEKFREMFPDVKTGDVISVPETAVVEGVLVVQLATARKEEENNVEEDPLAFIVHPRKKQLAEMILDGVDADEIEKAGFGPVQISEMGHVLIEKKLIDGDRECKNC